MVNYHKKKGKGKLPLFCDNMERVIPIYVSHMEGYKNDIYPIIILDHFYE